MNICFSSIFDLSRVQYEMAYRFENDGHKCFWITTDPTWYNWLISKGVNPKKILAAHFDDESAEMDVDSRIVDQIVASESKLGKTINGFIFADRFINKKSSLNQKRIACFYYEAIRHFLLKSSIDLVFAEPTNINELITEMVCNEFEIKFFYPQTLRYPSNRIFFEYGVGTGSMVKGYSSDREDSTNRQKIAVDMLQKIEPPKYFQRNIRKQILPVRLLERAYNRYRSLGKTKKHLTRHSGWAQITAEVLRVFRNIYLKWWYKYDLLDECSGILVYYGLHVQPESSIDVLGGYNTDQIKLIKDIVRSLPFDAVLIVKEHPNFLGTKQISFYEDLKRIPNVRVLNPFVSSFKIYPRVKAVISVSGTIAYEASILGIPAIVLSSVFFKTLNMVTVCKNISDLRSELSRVIRETVEPRKNHQDLMDLIDNSFPGNWSDPISDPSVMEDSNLKNLYKGFSTVIKHGVMTLPSED